MDIGERLRELCEAKGLSQGHIDKRNRLLPCCSSIDGLEIGAGRRDHGSPT